MAFNFRKLSKRFFITTNVVVVIIFLLACLQPWLNPEKFWLISFLSLALPYLLLLVVSFFVFWFFVKWPFTLISLVALLLGYRQIGVLFGTHNEPFVLQQTDNRTLRVLTWNVKSLVGIGRMSREQRMQIADNIVAVIASYRPDIVCLQEFGQFDDPKLGEDNIKRMQQAGYLATLLSRDYSRVRYGYTNGLAIFSKHPILAKKRIQFSSSPESLLYADIKFGTDTLRMFTSHLQSYKLIDRDFDQLSSAGQSGNNLVGASKNVFAKMKQAFRNRGVQAELVRNYLDSSHYPEIFCGDLNDVPGSYAYWQLRGNYRKDAHLEKGWGIGRTFIQLVPTLRIDYIFADQAWQVLQCQTIRTALPLSDHLPVVADLKLKP